MQEVYDDPGEVASNDGDDDSGGGGVENLQTEDMM
jgi:hypothetical protein